MEMKRRDWLKASAVSAAGMGQLRGAESELGSRLARILTTPELRPDLLREPLEIERIELLRAGKHWLVRARAAGLEGFADAHSSVMSASYPILLKKVAPHFAGTHARQL